MNVQLQTLKNPSHLPSLVLLHGWGFHSRAWPETWLSSLQKLFHVILVDLPGHGKAGICLDEYSDIGTDLNTPNDSSLLLLDTFITQLVRQLPDSFHMLGWSLGGQVAIQIANRYPQRVNSVACLGTNACFVASTSHQGMALDILQQFTHLYATNPEKTLARFCRLQSQGAVHRRCRAMLQQHVQPCDGQLLGLLWLAKLDLRQALQHIACPMLHVFAEADALVPITVMEEMSSLLRSKRTKHIAVAGCHGLPFEYPILSEDNHLWTHLMRHWQVINA